MTLRIIDCKTGEEKPIGVNEDACPKCGGELLDLSRKGTLLVKMCEQCGQGYDVDGQTQIDSLPKPKKAKKPKQHPRALELEAKHPEEPKGSFDFLFVGAPHDEPPRRYRDWEWGPHPEDRKKGKRKGKKGKRW